MSAVFPESINMLDKEDVKGSLSTLEAYIRYMCERVDFSTRNSVANQDKLASDVAAEGGKITNISAALNSKVDKEPGKGLSSNDYTDADKAELADHETRITDLETALSAAGPILIQNAADVTALDGDDAIFSVRAVGTSLTYKWELYYSSSWIYPNFPGRDTPNMTVTATSSRNGYRFRCTITGGGWTIYSKTVTLHVTS